MSRGIRKISQLFRFMVFVPKVKDVMFNPIGHRQVGNLQLTVVLDGLIDRTVIQGNGWGLAFYKEVGSPLIINDQ